MGHAKKKSVNPKIYLNNISKFPPQATRSSQETATVSQQADLLAQRLHTLEDQFAQVADIFLGWKFMSCKHCQELCQQATWLLLATQE